MSISEAVHILVVDDEAQIRALLRARFEKEGFRVTEASDGAGLQAALEAGPVSLITLDVKLGSDDGFAVAREVRSRRNVPIIMISAKDEEIDRVVGLELGADDYITKPFSPREVVARVKAVLRRYEPPAAAPPQPASSSPGAEGRRLAFAGGTLDLGRRELKDGNGAPVELTTAEFNLLELMLLHPQRVLTRDEIMNALKGHDWSPLDRSVDSAIARLRKRIEPDVHTPVYIKTVRGVGYVFTGDVQRD